MDILTGEEIDNIIDRSKIIPFYNREIDRKSAYEILGKKIEEANKKAEEVLRKEESNAKRTSRGRRSRKTEKSVLEQLSKNTMVRQVGRTLMKELARGLLGVLGAGGRRGLS
jgi:hypothetical protein